VDLWPSFYHSGSSELAVGVEQPPFIENFFRGQRGSAVVNFFANETVEVGNVIGGLWVHELSP
jgi:hypothetical protein